jgi:hypothetical protein
METDIPTQYRTYCPLAYICSTKPHWTTVIVFLFLWSEKHHLSSESGTEYNNITPDKDSDMEHAQSVWRTYCMFWLK